MFSFIRVRDNYKGGGAEIDPILVGVPSEDNTTGGDTSQRPQTFSIRQHMPAIATQKNFDCVGFAGAYLVEYNEMKENDRYTDLSGLFIYAEAKKLDGYGFRGTYISRGTYIPTVCGVATEWEYPSISVPDDPRGMPIVSESTAKHALKYKAQESVMITRGSFENYEGIKTALWRWKRPVSIGTVFYTSSQPNRRGELPLPKGAEKWGHNIVATGYDDNDTKRQLECANMFGEFWGDAGYCYLPSGFPVFPTAWISIDEVNVKKPTSDDALVDVNRDYSKEIRNGMVLWETLYKVFPAKSLRPEPTLAGKEWKDIVYALTYNDYRVSDIIAYLVEKCKGNIIYNLKSKK